MTFSGNAGVEFAVTKDLTAGLSMRGRHRNANSEASHDKKPKPRSGCPVVAVTTFERGLGRRRAVPHPCGRFGYTGVKDLALYSAASRKFGTCSEIITVPYCPTRISSNGEPFVKDNVYHVKGFNVTWGRSPPSAAIPMATRSSGRSSLA